MLVKWWHFCSSHKCNNGNLKADIKNICYAGLLYLLCYRMYRLHVFFSFSRLFILNFQFINSCSEKTSKLDESGPFSPFLTNRWLSSSMSKVLRLYEAFASSHLSFPGLFIPDLTGNGHCRTPVSLPCLGTSIPREHTCAHAQGGPIPTYRLYMTQDKFTLQLEPVGYSHW